MNRFTVAFTRNYTVVADAENPNKYLLISGSKDAHARTMAHEYAEKLNQRPNLRDTYYWTTGDA